MAKYIMKYRLIYIIYSHIKSGLIVFTMELSVKRLRRFDLPSVELDHAMIRVGKI